MYAILVSYKLQTFFFFSSLFCFPYFGSDQVHIKLRKHLEIGIDPFLMVLFLSHQNVLVFLLSEC